MSGLGAFEQDADERRMRLDELLASSEVAERSTVVEALTPLLRWPVVRLALPRIVAHLAAAGSPRRAALCLAQGVQTLEQNRGDASPLLVEPVLNVLISLSGASAWAARLIAMDPGLAVELGILDPSTVDDGRFDFLSSLLRIVFAVDGDTAAFDRSLRRYRHRHLLRLALLELRAADVRDTSAALASLADAVLEASLQHHRARLVEELGVPAPSCAAVVMGMGKLGGRELNYSSDIDVIYLYEHDRGQVAGLSMHEYHARLFERVTASLSRITDSGFVFRVDLDLRPEGRQGPLVNSVASIERYYETWGRTWERAAWVRGRPVAGDQALGERVVRGLRPFIFRRSFDLKAIEDILHNSRVSVSRRRARLRAGVDLKLGHGGIREIEFLVQAYQLLYGGRDARLRLTNTLDALVALETAGRITRRTRAILGDAYTFLRTVEHRIQLVDEMQTHTLPVDGDALDHLARSLRYPSGVDLTTSIERHMKAAHSLFTRFVGGVEEDDENIPQSIKDLIDAPQDEHRLEVICTLGAHDAIAALERIKTAQRLPGSPLHPSAERTRRAVGMQLLWACFESPDIDRALMHLPDLLKAILGHGTYLQQFEAPTRRRGVAQLLGASTLLARILVNHPSLVPEVICGPLPSVEALQHSLVERIASCQGDIELALGALRNAKHEEVLRIAVAELGDAIDGETVRQRLSALAEMVVAVALRLALEEVIGRFGAPEDPSASVAVLAGGTLGAREMSYRSDIDLSVVYRGIGRTKGGLRGAIDLSEFYTRVVQRLLAFLTIRMPQGDLYAVDMRLRPSGRQGALVATLDNFTAYHRRRAQLWERLALLRTRTIAGDVGLCASVDEAVNAAAYLAPVSKGAAWDIHAIRQRMALERSEIRSRRRNERILDLKLGRGGLVEFEFFVQHLLLRHGRDNPTIRRTSPRDALRALTEAGLYDEDEAGALLVADARLRRVQNWQRVAKDRMTDFVDLNRIRSLALTVGYHGSQAQQLLTDDLRRDTERIHRAYRQALAV